MKDYVTSPARVVYLKDIKALAGIAERGGGLEIGAGTRLADLVANPLVKGRYPALRQATLEVGTPQIRNMATVGGNLCQRPRCWYFRNGFGLLGVKDGKSLVRAGDNRYHAIFLTDGDALFVSPSSLAVPLIALGAEATILGPKGSRTVPVEKLYRVPKSNDDRELTLAPGELVTKVSIPTRRQERLVRGPPEAGARLAPGHGGRQLEDGRRRGPRRPRGPLRGRADPLAERGRRECDPGQVHHHGHRHRRRHRRRPGGQATLDERLQGHAGRDDRQAGPARRHRQRYWEEA